MSVNPDSVSFGNRREWKAFAERRPLFLERFDNLKDALSKAYLRSFQTSEPIDKMLFFMSRQAADDFFEIMMVCGNGEAIAGEKLLRSLYERVVTIVYLHKHPETFDAYVEYYHVTAKKVLDARREMWGKDLYPAEKVKEVEANFERVKENYRTRKCQGCGRKEMGPSWSPVSLGDMARAVGLRRYYYHAYARPLLEAHSSVKGTMGRLQGEPGRISWGDRVDAARADEVLATAHALLLHLFDVQIERFKVEGLEPLAQRTVEDFVKIWGADAKSDDSPEPTAPSEP